MVSCSNIISRRFSALPILLAFYGRFALGVGIMTGLRKSEDLLRTMDNPNDVGLQLEGDFLQLDGITILTGSAEQQQPVLVPAPPASAPLQTTVPLAAGLPVPAAQVPAAAVQAAPVLASVQPAPVTVAAPAVVAPPPPATAAPPQPSPAAALSGAGVPTPAPTPPAPTTTPKPAAKVPDFQHGGLACWLNCGRKAGPCAWLVGGATGDFVMYRVILKVKALLVWLDKK